MSGDTKDRLEGSWEGVARSAALKCRTPAGQSQLCCGDEPLTVPVTLDFIGDANSLRYTYVAPLSVGHSSGNFIFQPPFSWTAVIDEYLDAGGGTAIIKAVNAVDAYYCLHAKFLTPDNLLLGIKSMQTWTPGQGGSDPMWTSVTWCDSFVDISDAGGCTAGSTWPANLNSTVVERSAWLDGVVILSRVQAPSTNTTTTTTSSTVTTSAVGVGGGNEDSGDSLVWIAGLVVGFCLVLGVMACAFVSFRRRQRAATSTAGKGVVEPEATAVGKTAASGDSSMLSVSKSKQTDGSSSDQQTETAATTEVLQSSCIWGNDVSILAQGMSEHWMIQAADLTIEDNIAGQGGFGDVRIGMLYSSTKVALKTCKQATNGDSKAWQALANEMRLLRRIRHPNIVLFFGVSVMPGASLGLVLEWVEGLNLRSYTKQCNGWLFLVDGAEANPEADEKTKIAGPNHKAKLLLDVISGMQFLHAQRPPIIHRDLKPANVLVEMTATPPRAKITDFGISMLLRGDTGQGFAGTRAFMAPEVAANQAYNASADIYSFAVTCSYTFAGRTVQMPTAEENEKETERVLMLASAPQDVASLIVGCLSLEPTARPSLTDLRGAMATWMDLSGGGKKGGLNSQSSSGGNTGVSDTRMPGRSSSKKTLTMSL